MVRTQIQLTEEQARLVKQIAAERRVSMAEVIREGLDRTLRSSANALPHEDRHPAGHRSCGSLSLGLGGRLNGTRQTSFRCVPGMTKRLRRYVKLSTRCSTRTTITTRLRPKNGKRLLLNSSQLVTTNYVLVEATALMQHRLGVDAVRTFERDVCPVLGLEWIDEARHAAGMASVLAAGAAAAELGGLCEFSQPCVTLAFATCSHLMNTSQTRDSRASHREADRAGQLEDIVQIVAHRHRYADRQSAAIIIVRIVRKQHAPPPFNLGDRIIAGNAVHVASLLHLQHRVKRLEHERRWPVP